MAQKKAKGRKATQRPKKSRARKASNDIDEEQPRRRGGGNPWTSPRQSEYLEGRIEEFETARQTPKKIGLRTFWRVVVQDFLKEWPLQEDLDDEERDEQLEVLTSRIKVWYNNHCRSTDSKSKSNAVMDFLNKKKRRRSLVHTYWNHFGEEKVVPLLTERWEQEEKCPGPGSPVPLWFRNKLTAELYGDETEEMKEEVERLREEDLDEEEEEGEYQYLLDEEGIDEEEIKRRQKIIVLQRNIDALPNTIVSILETVREQTGFMCACVFFGSEPKRGGNVVAYSSSVGETPVGTTIMEYIPGFQKTFEDNAIDFGLQAISISERSDLCMPGMEGKRNYVGSRSDSHRGSEGEGRSTKGSSREQATLSAAASKTNPGLSGTSKRRRDASEDHTFELDNNDGPRERHGKNREVDRDNTDADNNDADNGDNHEDGNEDENNEDGNEDENEDENNEDENEDDIHNAEEIEELRSILDSVAGVPDWLSKAVTYLYQPNDLWVDVLRMFIKFEEALGFPQGKAPTNRLSVMCRPSCLSQFISNHRNKEPTIRDHEAFADELYVWWISLQPQSRRDDREASVSDARSLACLASEVPEAETWEDLRKGSKNGVYGILCCLSWWLRIDSGLASDDLLNLIQDVLWVLEVMSEVSEGAIAAARKRKSDDEEASPRKKARTQPSRSQPPPRSKSSFSNAEGASLRKARTQPSRSQPPSRSKPSFSNAEEASPRRARTQPSRSQPPSRSKPSQSSHSRSRA
ncbi:hypothetical protein EYR40_002554 [Pleurotus pulmonarius]|nr:hypothetical protein EYR40_002554 [Pleurotus pulmonarius]